MSICKKNNIKIILYFSILFVFMNCILLPSSSYAAISEFSAACNANGDFESTNGNGTEESPFIISTDNEKITISFSEYGKFKYPFYYKLATGSNGINVGKYMVDIDNKNLKITFTLIEGNTGGEPFPVAAGIIKDKKTYSQVGGVLEESSTKIKFTPPVYKIVEHLSISSSNSLSSISVNTAPLKDTVLGNTYIGLDSVASNYAPYSTAYVFAADQSTTTVVGGASSTTTQNVMYAFHGTNSEVLDDNENTTIERIIAKVLYAVGDVFMGIVQKVGGTDLSIDALVFNEYQPTIVDFFNDRGLYNNEIKQIVNGWYGAFSVFARAVIMIVLVAIGVKAMMIAGTGNQKKISNMVVGWIMAVVILFFGPYGMKYAIEINDAFVKILRSESKYSLYSVYNSDFIGKYQLGEDSATVTIQDLIQLQGELTDDVSALQETLNSYKTGFTAAKDRLNERWEEVVQSTSTTGTPVYYYDNSRMGTDITEITVKIESIVKNGGSFDSNLVNVRVEETNADAPMDINDIKLASKNYYSTYKAYIEKKDDLSAVERAIRFAESNVDLMGIMRNRAGTTYRLLYVIIWFLLIYQLILMLFLYYKRLITIAALITIFPLVVMMYAYEKMMGIDSPKTMKTWTQEYIVNVFIQSIHALLYLTLVENGLAIFEKDADNWLLFVFAVTAMFPMEAIVKSIIGVKGSTVSNLASSAKKGVGYYFAARGIMSVGGKLKDMDTRYENSQNKANMKREKADKKTETKRLERDNKETKDMSYEERQRKLAENKAKDEKEDKKKQEKRDKQDKARKRVRQAAKAAQLARNVGAKMGAITTGLAGGGDIEDFNAGAAVSGMLAGANRKVSSIKNNSKGGSKPKAPKSSSAPTNRSNSSAALGNRYSNINGVGGNRAAENAQNTMNANQNVGGSGQINPENAGANANVTPQMSGEQIAGHQRIEDAFIHGIAARRDVNVKNNTHYDISDY